MKYRAACDLETGGIYPNEVDALSCYMAVVDEDDQIVEDLDLKLKPDDGRLPIAHQDALKINGIDLQAHLADPTTITYSEAAEKILTMLKKYREKGKYSNIRFAGFNCSYDKKFIHHHLIPEKELEKIIHYKCVDTMEAVDLLKRAGWLPPSVGTLESCIDHFQLPKGRTHTAKDDIIMTLAVDKKILELMASKKDGGNGGIDLISLLEAE
jgi:oligoribonuclease (3'-5' exoribonuclease)